MGTVLQVLLNEVSQELLQHPGSIVKPALQCHHSQGGNGTSVPHGETTLALQRVDEGQQEGPCVQQLPKEMEPFLGAWWCLYMSRTETTSTNPLSTIHSGKT